MKAASQWVEDLPRQVYGDLFQPMKIAIDQEAGRKVQILVVHLRPGFAAICTVDDRVSVMYSNSLDDFSRELRREMESFLDFSQRSALFVRQGTRLLGIAVEPPIATAVINGTVLWQMQAGQDLGVGILNEIRDQLIAGFVQGSH